MEQFQEHTSTSDDAAQVPLLLSDDIVEEYQELYESTISFNERFDSFRKSTSRILYECFVQYNPLYFFSALCVLGGMFFVSVGLREMDWTRGQLWLTLVIQGYELLVIAGAALIFRTTFQKRPAVILCIIAVVFLFDCTFRTEVATTLEQANRFVAGGWFVMVILKLLALKWAFHLKVSRSALFAILLLACGIAVFPQLFEQYDGSKETLHLFATWYAIGLTAFAYWKRPQISCRLSFDEWGETVLRRVIKAAWIIWFGWYFLHLFIWISLFSIRITPAHIAPLFLLGAVFAKHEAWIWIFSGLSVATTTPPTMMFMAMMVGFTLAWKGFQISQKRLYIGAVLAGYLALWTYGWQHWPLPDINLALSLATAIILILMAWKLKLPSALLPLLAGVYPAMQGVQSLDFVGRGSILLALGFLALVTGVAFNWSQRKVR